MHGIIYFPADSDHSVEPSSKPKKNDVRVYIPHMPPFLGSYRGDAVLGGDGSQNTSIPPFQFDFWVTIENIKIYSKMESETVVLLLVVVWE